jgi:hypothetical protein
MKTYRIHGIKYVQGSGFRVQGSGFRVQGSGFRVQGSGFIYYKHIECTIARYTAISI